MIKKYTLFGFYNFLDVIPDFVYPIFERENRLYYEMGQKRIEKFIELSEYECSKVKRLGTQNVRYLGEKYDRYNFKVSSDLIFAYQNSEKAIVCGNGKNISQYLRNIKTNNTYTDEVIQDFLEEIEDILLSTSKEYHPLKLYHYATGRRKKSVARVYLCEGSGDIVVNNLAINKYFNGTNLIGNALRPLQVLDLSDKVDIRIMVRGGGFSGQSGAISLGIARALLKMNSEYRRKLKEFGLLTRDPRMKERKKYGLKGARKAPQFSKR